jgi:AcrR family transcriptional regulator
MPAGFSERERDAINKKLLETALASLPAGGYAKTSLDEIVRAVGIAKGSFYLFFPSKEELYMQAFERMETGFRARFFGSVTADGGDPRERLERAFLTLFSLVESNPAIAAIDASLVDRLARKLPPERIAAHQEADKAASLKAYESWLDAGLVKPVGIDALMGAIYSLFNMAVHRREMPAEQWVAAKTLIAGALAAELATGEKEKS